jgi:hypothetical protein
METVGMRVGFLDTVGIAVGGGIILLTTPGFSETRSVTTASNSETPSNLLVVDEGDSLGSSIVVKLVQFFIQG